MPIPTLTLTLLAQLPEVAALGGLDSSILLFPTHLGAAKAPLSGAGSAEQTQDPVGIDTGCRVCSIGADRAGRTMLEAQPIAIPVAAMAPMSPRWAEGRDHPMGP